MKSLVADVKHDIASWALRHFDVTPFPWLLDLLFSWIQIAGVPIGKEQK